MKRKSFEQRYKLIINEDVSTYKNDLIQYQKNASFSIVNMINLLEKISLDNNVDSVQFNNILKVKSKLKDVLYDLSTCGVNSL